MKSTLFSLSTILAALVLAHPAQSQTAPSGNAPNQAQAGGVTNEAQARELIIRDGYTDVGSLAKGQDGQWRGTAKRGNESFEVTVDREGKVSR